MSPQSTQHRWTLNLRSPHYYKDTMGPPRTHSKRLFPSPNPISLDFNPARFDSISALREREHVKESPISPVTKLNGNQAV